MLRPALPLACTAVALLLTGCAADTTNYPSLARRPAERVTGSADVAASAVPVPPAPVAPSPDLVARLEQIQAQANAAHNRFTDRLGAAERLVGAARGAAVASESWAVASVALAELEASRSQAMIALADLDQLYAAARIEGGPAEAIAQTRDRVIAMVGHEDGALARLRGALRS
jgi:hypothetical protein